jgi:acetyltransferase
MSFPEGLLRTIDLDGERLAIRPVRPEDAPRLVEAVHLCSEDDVRARFCGGLSSLPLELATRFSQPDAGQMAFVAEDAAGAIVGAARADLDPARGAAEYSILVRSDHQGHGLGGVLLQAILDAAAGRGDVSEVWGDVARDNIRMIELAEALGFRSQPAEDPARCRMVWRPAAGQAPAGVG